MHGAPAGTPEKRVYRSAAARSLGQTYFFCDLPMEKVGEPVYVRYLEPNWAMGVLSVPGPPESVHAHAGDQIMLSTLGVESHGQACYDSQSGIILPGTCCFYQR
jgi:hypothetical protein